MSSASGPGILGVHADFWSHSSSPVTDAGGGGEGHRWVEERQKQAGKKGLGCPQAKQRTWAPVSRQTNATPRQMGRRGPRESECCPCLSEDLEDGGGPQPNQAPPFLTR